MIKTVCLFHGHYLCFQKTLCTLQKCQGFFFHGRLNFFSGKGIMMNFCAIYKDCVTSTSCLMIRKYWYFFES